MRNTELVVLRGFLAAAAARRDGCAYAESVRVRDGARRVAIGARHREISSANDLLERLFRRTLTRLTFTYDHDRQPGMQADDECGVSECASMDVRGGCARWSGVLLR